MYAKLPCAKHCGPLGKAKMVPKDVVLALWELTFKLWRKDIYMKIIINLTFQ